MARDGDARAVRATRTGIPGALGFAAWLGISAFRAVHPLEIVIIGLLVGVALFTAWRFYLMRGWIAGPVLMIALIIEVTKRFASAIQGIAYFSIFEVITAVLIFLGLVIGIRGARTMRDAEASGSNRAVL